MPVLQIPKETLTYIAEHLDMYTEEKIISRGFDYYFRESVSELEIINDGGEVFALVEGTEFYQVTLDLHFFLNSSCTCPYEGLCKHIVAVFFYLYQAAEDPRHLLSAYKDKKREGTQNPIRPQTKKKPAHFSPLESDSPVEWLRYIGHESKKQSLFQHFDVEYKINRFIESQQKVTKNWNLAKKKFFDLYLHLSLVKGLEETGVQNRHYYYNPNLNNIQNLFYRLFELISKLGSSTDLQKVEGHLLVPLATFLTEAMFSSKKFYREWISVYQVLWSKALNRGPWVNSQRERLEKALMEADLSDLQQDICYIALAHHDFMERKDQAAQKHLQPTLDRGMEHITPYLNTFHHYQDWDRLLNWLRWLRPFSAYADREAALSVSRFWTICSKQDPSIQREAKMALVAMLPRSFGVYSEYLFELKAYPTWIDLLLTERISPMEIPTHLLKEIEQYDRRLLLPLYHRDVERLIQLRGRPYYKDAVKLLKKLRAHYKHLKMQSQWDRYVSFLTSEYSRLRAFQEELEKGKIRT